MPALTLFERKQSMMCGTDVQMTDFQKDAWNRCADDASKDK